MIQVGSVSGETRRVETGVPYKTGIAWTLDAKTGEFLWVKSTFEQNMVASVDGGASSAVGYARIIIPLGKAPERLDCNALYMLDIQRLKAEIELLKIGLE